MSCSVRPHQGDWGTIFEALIQKVSDAPSGDPFEEEVTVPADITGATITFTFKPPDAAAFSRAGVVFDGPGGIARYTAMPGDLRWFGDWQFQAHAALPGGAGAFSSAASEFTVDPNLGPASDYLDLSRLEVATYLPQVAVVIS
jgi:hypothetical protein